MERLEDENGQGIFGEKRSISVIGQKACFSPRFSLALTLSKTDNNTYKQIDIHVL